MSDNSTLKYIGIYTGDKATAPTNAREYSWTKIRGEDGARGRDGKDGEVEFNLLKGTKDFISGYFAPPDPWQRANVWVDEIERYEDFAVKSTIYQSNGLWQNVELEKGKTYEYGFYAKGDRTTNNIFFDVAWGSQSAKTPLVQVNIKTFNFELTTNWKFYSFRFTATATGWSQCRVEKSDNSNNLKLCICGMYLKEVKNNQQTPLKWSPSMEDLQGRTLTANLRFEGTYINNITNNVKPYLDVYYDGQKITSGFNAQVKYKGGNSYDWSGFWTANVGTDGGITNLDWGNREQNGTPLEVIVLVTYKGLNTVANTRMENIPDVVEIKEITKKYKTFESTIDQFNSTIGEVKQQVLANEEKRNLVLGSRMFNEKDYKLFGGSITRSVFQEYNGLPYMSMVSYEGNKHIWQGVGFNLSFSRIKKGERYSIRLPIRLSSALSLDLGAYVEIKNHLTRGILWNARLDVNNVQKDKWIEREFQFTADRDFDLGDGSFWIYIVRGGYINFAQPYMCEGDTLPKKYSPAPEDFYLQNSRIESSIIQTKEQIGLKVSKDEIISAINLSVEKDGNGQDAGLVKIDASRVDIRGALKAFQGDIGTFSIGGNKHTGYGKWITGVNQFQIGMSDGTNGALGTALWVNWGDKWNVEGKQSWYVMNNGAMIVNNRANINALYVTGDSYFARRLRAQGDGVDVGGSDVYGTASGIGTSVIWWSQIDDVKSSVSDGRLKTNVNSTKVNALETLNNIEMVEFNWIKDGEFEKIGAIAQQVQSVEETLVVNDTSDKNNPSDYLRISYYNCIPYLIKAIQELSTKNQQLKSQLQLMNERLTKLEEQLNGKL